MLQRESTYRIMTARDPQDPNVGMALLSATDPFGETFCVCRVRIDASGRVLTEAEAV